MSPNILDVTALTASGISSSAIACGFPVFDIKNVTSYEANIAFSLSQPVAVFVLIFVLHGVMVVSYENIMHIRFCLLYVLFVDDGEIWLPPYFHYMMFHNREQPVRPVACAFTSEGYVVFMKIFAILALSLMRQCVFI